MLSKLFLFLDQGNDDLSGLHQLLVELALWNVACLQNINLQMKEY